MKVKQQGFTLIEILVSLLISSITILGLYSLQIKDQELWTDLLIQNEAQTQVSNLRELIFSSPDNSSVTLSTLRTLSHVDGSIKTEIVSLNADQLLLRTRWTPHLQQENSEESAFSLAMTI
jgi:prepilin-type N-terminal cleavage/methylation domain-containing protein